MSEKDGIIFRWVEKEVHTPLFDALFAPPPIYTRKTIDEPIEPMYAVWQDLTNLIDAIRGDVDEDYWEPNDNYWALEKLREKVEPLAFREVPNPDYDDERAEAWHTAHPRRRPYNNVTMYIGQSYNPEVQRGQD